jgi:hypothetical protein
MRIIAIPFRGLLKRSIIPLSCYLESAYLSGNNPATVQPQSIDLFGPPIQKSPYPKRRDPKKSFAKIAYGNSHNGLAAKDRARWYAHVQTP